MAETMTLAEANEADRQSLSGKTPAGPHAGTSERQTEPAHYLPNAEGGLMFIPRRDVESGLLTTKEALRKMAGETPLRLLSYLVDVSPALGLAVWNLCRLGAPPDGLKIVAVKPKKGEIGDDEEDDKATGLIEKMWKSLPKEIGGLHGLQTTLLLSAALTGLPFVEAVPGARMQGVHRVWPVDSLTLRFIRQGPDLDAVPYQLQNYPRDKKARSNWVELDTKRMFWRPIDSLPDDPHGRAPLAPALGEILRDLAMMQDLTDTIHQTASPRLGIPFNFAEMYKLARETYGLEKDEAEKWVNDQFRATVREFSKLKPGGNIHYDSSGDLVPIEGANGFAALTSILEYLRQRITQAVKSLPTLLGINDGSTQTYTSVEWAIYAAGLETLRSITAQLLVDVANLHLQLLGLDLVAKAIYEPIRTTDAKAEADVEKAQIENEARKRDEGWQHNDQASQKVTGTDAVAEPIRKKNRTDGKGGGKNGTASSDEDPAGNRGTDKSDEEKPGGKPQSTEQQQQPARRRFPMPKFLAGLFVGRI